MRDLNSEKAALLGEGLTETPIELVEGSLNSSQEELEAMLSGCTTCISCSGTERTTKVAPPSAEIVRSSLPLRLLLLRILCGYTRVLLLTALHLTYLLQLFDVFGGALDDPAHPYNVNYKGIETLCAAMTAQGCKKVAMTPCNLLPDIHVAVRCGSIASSPGCFIIHLPCRDKSE